MPSTATLLNMRNRVRSATDQERSTFITDTELNDWINQGIKVVWRILVTADPSRGVSTTTVTTTAGTELYALPADFMSIRGLDYPVSGSLTVDVYPYEFSERNQLNTVYAAINRSPTYYRVALGSVDGDAARLSLRPDPGNKVLTLHYVAVPVALSADGDTFDGIIGFDEYPVLWASIEVRAKAEETDAKEQRGLAKVERQIATEAGRRDRGGKRRIADTRNRDGYQHIYPFSS